MKPALSRPAVFHPFLFALYSVAGIYARNSGEIPYQWVFRPLIVILLLTATVYFILKRRIPDPHYVGLLTTLGLFWFFFGHFARVLEAHSEFWSTGAGLILAGTLWTGPLAFMASPWTWRHIQNRAFITTFLNATSAVIVLFPAVQATIFVAETLTLKDLAIPGAPLLLSQPNEPPDIYLIIMDGYGRQDVLRDVHHYDNSKFITFLQSKNFYVAEKASANYPQTLLSVGSMLNLTYLNESVRGLQSTDNRAPLVELLQHSEVRRSLQAAGYRFVALPSAIWFTQIRDADVYYAMSGGTINEFEGVLLSSTVLNPLIQALNLDLHVPSYDLHRRYLLFGLEALKDVPDDPGPKFVFAHILGPHPPFVLDANGNPVEPSGSYNILDASMFQGTPQQYSSGYTAEMTYLNSKLEEVIEAILAKSSRPPIIIIEGDHGPGAYFDETQLEQGCLIERYSNLNAYYFPDQEYGALYPAITPVNSFRIVFNQYFGTDLPILEDLSYYATWRKPYVYTDISDKIGPTCELPED